MRKQFKARNETSALNVKELEDKVNKIRPKVHSDGLEGIENALGITEISINRNEVKQG